MQDAGMMFFKNGKATVAGGGGRGLLILTLTPFAGISRIRFKGFLRV